MTVMNSPMDLFALAPRTIPDVISGTDAVRPAHAARSAGASADPDSPVDSGLCRDRAAEWTVPRSRRPSRIRHTARS